MDQDAIDALKQELNCFMRLTQAQAEQLSQYKKLQQRSHQLIQSLISQKSTVTQSWKKSKSTTDRS